MSEHKAIATSEPSLTHTSPGRMYATVIGVGIACTLAIVIVYETTEPIIRRKQVERRQEAILDVLPAALKSSALQFTASGRFERVSHDTRDSDLVFAGYDAKNNLVGLAIEAEGMGYQDVVRVLYGYSFETQSIVGMRVLQTRETPGLGDRIETDVDFLRNFDNLDVRLNPDGNELVHPIEFVKPGKKRSAWQIDGISGATITSKAVASILRESSAHWIPRAYRQLADFDIASQEDGRHE